MSSLRVHQAAGVQLVRAADRYHAAEAVVKPTGRFVVEHYRNGKRINEYHFPNGITNEGKNKLLGLMFNQATQIGTWYLGLIDAAGFTALANTDDYDNINQAANGWDEFTNYTDANNANSATTRPEWQENSPSAQSITNSTVAIFNITGSGTVKGVFLAGGIANANLKGDHAPGGTLWATALFSSGDVAVQNGDQLKVTYSVSA